MIGSWDYASLFNLATYLRVKDMTNAVLAGKRLAQILVGISNKIGGGLHSFF